MQVEPDAAGELQRVATSSTTPRSGRFDVTLEIAGSRRR